MAFPSKIPDSDLPQILERYRNKEKLTDIAAEYGCSDKALYQRMRLYCDSGKGDTNYHDLVTDLYVLRQLDAEEKLATAPDMLEVTRARELVKCSQWHLERRRAKLFGAKQQVEMDNKITVTVNKFVHQQGQLPSPPTQVVDSNVVDITPDSVSG